MTTDILPFTPSSWIINAPQKVGAMEMGARTTIIALPSGRLAMISPVAFDDAQAAQIDELGQVDTIIAPNLFHHLYFNDACQRWPNARALVPAGLSQKVELPERAQPMAPKGSIEGALSWHLIQGAPKTQEHVFLFPEDELLIVTDLAFHFQDHPQLWLRIMMRLLGSYGRLAPSRIFKSTIKDKRAFKESISTLLKSPFDAMIMAHGEPIKSGAHQAFQGAFAAFL